MQELNSNKSLTNNFDKNPYPSQISRIQDYNEIEHVINSESDSISESTENNNNNNMRKRDIEEVSKIVVTQLEK